MSMSESSHERVERPENASESDPDMINRDIDHTRAAMAETLDEIQRRLEPDQVSSYVKDVAYYVVLELKSAVGELAGQARTSLRDSGAQRRRSDSAPSDDADRRGASFLGRLTDAAANTHTRQQVVTKGSQMSQHAEGLWKKLEANPIALGAIGLAVGGLVAALAPRTQQEDHAMGETSDRLLEDLCATAERAVETVRTGAVETGSEVLKAATDPR